MAKIIFITGGQRSGKSSFAQKTALELSDNPVYLATARIWDDDFRKRIERHQSDRDERWQTVEEEKYLSGHNFDTKTVVIDCITLWLTNFFVDLKPDYDRVIKEAKAEFSKLIDMNSTFIVVSNEVGMSLHAETEAGRKFTDIQGWMNQYIAQLADEVYLLISGIPIKIKG